MTERRVLWSQTARNDLDDIVDYIAADSIDNALAVLDRLQQRAESLIKTAQRGRVGPELLAIGVHQYRELIERPWRILYRVAPDSVTVLAVLDGRRDLELLLLERLVRI
jgi:toxin ParE1/3/4